MKTDKWFKVMYDTIDMKDMTVQVQIQDKENWQTYKMYETEKGTYINLLGKKEYILVPTE